MSAQVVSCIENISAAEWNALQLNGNPTVSHEFLATLEREHCVGGDTGWIPAHLVLRGSDGTLRGAVPLYRKTHSWGEFVFDWSWAQAYAQAGLNYYPKLVCMVPFTPAPGPRLLVAEHAPPTTRQDLIQALLELARSEQASTLHALFVDDGDRAAFKANGFLLRKDCQFHWYNREYATFEQFLGTFRAEKRKKAARERRRVQEAGITFRTVAGEDMDARLWDIVYGFSSETFAIRGHEHYLNADFFRALSAAKPGCIMVKLAEFGGRPIAAAIFFVGTDTLYGRYWGAAAEFHSLHFETCYYQGIEYCIEHGLSRFEPGTQGEHKVARGFEPSETWSAHWIADSRFRRAIQSYLRQEQVAVDQYIAEVQAHVPYRRDAAFDTTRESE
jgi:predicted N-acyltransferase